MGCALITGASSGLGRDLAHLFAADGHDVVLVARREERLIHIATEVEARYGSHAAAIVADLSMPDGVQVVARAIANTGIDYLVNNAGFGVVGQFASTQLASELGMIQLHVVATTHLTKILLPPMIERGYGRILNVSSIAAFLPGPYAAVYYATKSYVLLWSEALAEELANTRVTVTTVCPGRMATEFMAAADVPDSRWLAPPAPSLPVARQAYRAMHRGQRLIVPGVVNKTIPAIIRLMPRRLVTKITRAIQQRG